MLDISCNLVEYESLVNVINQRWFDVNTLSYLDIELMLYSHIGC